LRAGGVSSRFARKKGDGSCKRLEGSLDTICGMDRRLAQRNIRSGLIATAIALALFIASFAAAFIY
jgi:hypothetical protein